MSWYKESKTNYEITEDTELDWELYLPIAPPVKAELCEEDCELKTSWGETLKAKRGEDYIITNTEDKDDKWPIKKGIFDKTYKKLDNSLYKKIAPTKAIKIDFDGICKTREGDVHFKSGFYICKGEEGEVWPISPEKFHKKFKKKPK
jgi:hypothetical protein